METLQKFSKFLLALGVRILAAVLVGTILLTMVYCIPTERMDQNLKESAPIFEAEGSYPVLFSWCSSQLDNTTDAVILSNAAHISQDPLLTRTMAVKRSYIEGMDICDALVAHYIYDQPFDIETPYYRYWHGYLIFIKPLLYFSDFYQIRSINTVVQITLLVTLIWLMVKQGLRKYILPYCISFLFLMPVALAQSLQYSSCYYILTLGSIAILWKKDAFTSQPISWKSDALIFLYLGISTAYFDFLTYPIATLGIPAVVYFCIRKTDSIRNTFCTGVKICFSWGLGYIGMWAGKWIIGSLITGENILTNAANTLALRTSANMYVENSTLYNLYLSLSRNLVYFLQTPATILLLAAGIILLVYAVIQHRKHSRTVFQAAQTLFPFFVLACFPIIWYLVAANHSFIHSWFTYKALIVSAFAALAALVKLREDSQTA